jgi:multidrug efflux pump subunit AcrB
MNLIRGSHHRATAIFLLLLALVAAGLFEALRLPSSIFPSVTFPVVKVIADVGDEPAERMMPAVTRPLEEAFHRVPGATGVLSTTSRGSSEIRVQFAWGTDMQIALQRVEGEVQRLRPDLPADAKIDVEWMNTAIFPILGYALTSGTESQADLWELAEYTLKPELIRVPGVSEVQVQGGRRREFQVRLRRDALAARKLSAADVVTAVEKNNQILSAGLQEANHELYLSLVDGRARGIESLGRIAVPVPGGGVPARLSDLATIAVDDAVSYVRTTANGRPAVLVNIIRQPSANTVSIAEGINALLKSRPDLIPKDVQWKIFYDQAEFVTHSVHSVRDAILIGVFLAVAVLWLFLKDFWTSVIAVAIIPVTCAIALLVFGAAGQSVNLMTMGGIAAAIGLVVDDAIVVVENIHQHRFRETAANAAEAGAAEILPPLTGSSLSTIAVFLPFALLSGVVGAFFRPLAFTIAVSLTISYLIAAFAVPAAVRAIERRKERRHARTLLDRPSRFDRAVRFTVGRPWIAAAAVVFVLGGGFLFYEIIGTDFLPQMDEGSIILDYRTPPGTSLTDTNAMLDEIEHEVIEPMPDVATYSRRTGTQLGFFITEPNTGDYVIKLKPRSQRRPVDEVIDDLRTKIAAVEPSIRTDFGQLLEDNIGDLSGGTPQPVDVKVFGENQTLLQERARDVARIVRSVPGTEDVFDGITIAGPALDIQVRPAGSVDGETPGSGNWSAAGGSASRRGPSAGVSASRGAASSNATPAASLNEPARFGLTTEDIHAAIEPAVAGTVAGNLRIGERLYDVRVFAKGSGPLSDLLIRSPNGALVPLHTVARIETGPPEVEIDRDNLKTYLGVTARLSGRSLGEAMREVREKLDSSLHLGPGESIRFGGLYEQQQTSFKGLLVVLLAGLMLVAVIVLFEFGDWRAPLLTVLVALAVLTGVFGALLLTGMTFNISSFVGAIFMVGIVGEKSVFLIQAGRNELRSGKPPREAWAAAAGGHGRFRPVAETTLATGFALAPLAFAIGEGSQLLQPLAIAVIGGFVLSGVLVLFVLPSLYCWLDPKGRLAGRDQEPGGKD